MSKTPKKSLLSAVGGVEIVLLENDRGVWACYIDGLMSGWGGNEMTAKELLKALNGRAVKSYRVVDAGQWFPNEFPRDLSEVPDGIL